MSTNTNDVNRTHAQSPAGKMTWYNKLQFLAMILAVAGVAAEWHVGLWMALGLGGVSIICIFAQRSFPAFNSRWGLVAMVAYWLMLLGSVLYSADLSAAKELLVLKGTLLIFPLAVLLTNMSWLGSNHLRALGYALAITMFISFLYYSGVGVGKLINGVSLSNVCGNNFDPRHHAYTALYLCVAMVFVYYELFTRWSVLPGWWRVLLIVSGPVFILYNIIVNSRAGMLTMYAIEAYVVLHFALTRRRWGWAVLLAVLLAGYTIGMQKVVPGFDDRVGKTLDDMKEDVRMDIYKSDLDAAMESPIIGFGAGDYHEQLKQQYAENKFKSGVKAEYNAHNQYFETLLSIGFIGLAVFLLWLFWPLWSAWRGLRKGTVSGAVFWTVFMLTFCVAFNFLFESVLERQMGILFVGALMPIMTLIVNVEQNKFGQLPKK